MCIAGSNSATLKCTNKKVNVSPFTEENQAILDVPIATVTSAWDDAKTGETTNHRTNKSLYFKEQMKQSLLCQINCKPMDGQFTMC
jgi:hypothetical protein